MPLYYSRRQQVVNRTVEYGDPADARDPGLTAFFALWNAARGTRSMPVRGDIDPKGLRQWLPMVQLHDVIDGGADFRFRVSGSEVFLVNGVDMTGKMVSQQPNEGVRDRLMGVLKHVTDTGRPVHARFESMETFQVPHRVVESIYLPLGEGEDVRQVIGLTIFPNER